MLLMEKLLEEVFNGLDLYVPRDDDVLLLRRLCEPLGCVLTLLSQQVQNLSELGRHHHYSHHHDQATECATKVRLWIDITIANSETCDDCEVDSRDVGDV